MTETQDEKEKAIAALNDADFFLCITVKETKDEITVDSFHELTLRQATDLLSKFMVNLEPQERGYIMANLFEAISNNEGLQHVN